MVISRIGRTICISNIPSITVIYLSIDGHILVGCVASERHACRSSLRLSRICPLDVRITGGHFLALWNTSKYCSILVDGHKRPETSPPTCKAHSELWYITAYRVLNSHAWSATANVGCHLSLSLFLCFVYTCLRMPQRRYKPKIGNIAPGDTIILSSTSVYTARGLVEKTKLREHLPSPKKPSVSSPSKARKGLTPSNDESHAIDFDNILLEPLQLPTSKVLHTFTVCVMIIN
jgi:hypothetical protein